MKKKGRGQYVVHVDADGAAGGPDLGRGQEDVEAGAAAEVDDGLALLGGSESVPYFFFLFSQRRS